MAYTAKDPCAPPPTAFSVPNRRKKVGGWKKEKEEKEKEKEEKKSICWPTLLSEGVWVKNLTENYTTTGLLNSHLMKASPVNAWADTSHLPSELM